MSHVALDRVLNARASISARLDLRLSRATGTPAGHWLTKQQQYDLQTASAFGYAY